MNKRITSLLLCFVMVLTMLATAVPVYAVSSHPAITVSIEPDKTTAAPGETINYSVVVSAVECLQSITYALVIPEGLEFVPNSGTIPAGLNETLHTDEVDWTEMSKVYFAYGVGSYTSTSPTTLFTFQCKVKEDATGTQEVKFDTETTKLSMGDDEYEKYDTTPITTPVTITAAPKPATGITLDKSTMELYTGNSGTLTATVTPADTTDIVEWSTDDATVATVINGTVTAVAPGTATITVKAGDYTATCTVTVTNAPCAHTNKTPVPAEESTCAVKGWDAYQTCNDCGKFFDMDNHEISGIPYRTLKDHTPGPAATEDTDQTCTECGAVLTPALGHIHANHLTPVAAAAATCTDAGNTAYYKCSCGKLFTDDTAATETTLEAVTINALGHDHSGAWVSDDDEHWKVCAREGCGERLDTAAHNPSDWTFIGDGHHDKKCTVCGKQVAHEACESTIKYDDAKHWHECIKCGNISGTKEDHSYAPKSETNPNPDKCTGCDYVKSSIKVTVPETTEIESGSKNPTTGAADNGMIGIAAAVLVAAGAAYVGFKKRG